MMNRLLPPAKRMLLPLPPSGWERHFDASHESFEPLSAGCWVAHLSAQAVASHVALGVLIPSTNGARRALGLATVLSTLGGGLLLGSHALIGRDELLEKALYAAGTRVVRAASLVIGVGILLPKCFAVCFLLLLGCCSVELITFSNRIGRLLSLLSLVVVATSASLGVPYRAAYTAFALLVPLLPSSQYDKGHTIVATSLGLPTAVLLLAP
jgi:hypothetical protein